MGCIAWDTLQKHWSALHADSIECVYAALGACVKLTAARDTLANIGLGYTLMAATCLRTDNGLR